LDVRVVHDAFAFLVLLVATEAAATIVLIAVS
jgi:hypothetical protein